jgi:hypothetical protein
MYKITVKYEDGAEYVSNWPTKSVAQAIYEANVNEIGKYSEPHYSVRWVTQFDGLPSHPH